MKSQVPAENRVYIPTALGDGISTASCTAKTAPPSYTPMAVENGGGSVNYTVTEDQPLSGQTARRNGGKRESNRRGGCSVADS